MSIPLIEIVGVWIATYLTIAIFSFLYKDNPLFKIAEAIFVGTSYGYNIVVLHYNFLKPKFWLPLGRLFKSLFSDKVVLESTDSWLILVPTILGVLLLFQMIPKYSWLARYAFAFVFGIGTGQGIIPSITASIFKQADITMQPFMSAGPFSLQKINVNAIIILIGVLSVLAYFFFSFERKGIWKNLSTLGLYFLLISFGAAYGYTVMGRETLLIGRIEFFMKYSIKSKYFYPILLVIPFVIYFIVSAVRNNKVRSKKQDV